MAVSSSRRALLSSAMTFGEPFMVPRSIAPESSGVSSDASCRGETTEPAEPADRLAIDSDGFHRRSRAAPSRPHCQASDKFEAGEEVADFKSGGLRCVGAMRDVVADA